MPECNSKQEKFDETTIKKHLENYTIIKNTNFKSIVGGDFIRYIVDGKFRMGGVCVQNNYPKYIVLKNVVNNITWCVQLGNPTLKLYSKKKECTKKMKEEKDKIYELYKSGKLSLIK